AEAVHPRDEFRIGIRAHFIGGFGEFNVVRGAITERSDAQADQAAFPLVGDVVIGEDVDVFQHDVVPVQNQLGEALGTRIVHGSRDQPEVTSAAAIGTEVGAVAATGVPVILGVHVVV